jgi:hypothetical protein
MIGDYYSRPTKVLHGGFFTKVLHEVLAVVPITERPRQRFLRNLPMGTPVKNPRGNPVVKNLREEPP